MLLREAVDAPLGLFPLLAEICCEISADLTGGRNRLTCSSPTYVHSRLYVMQCEQRLLGICAPLPDETRINGRRTNSNMQRLTFDCMSRSMTA